MGERGETKFICTLLYAIQTHDPHPFEFQILLVHRILSFISFWKDEFHTFPYSTNSIANRYIPILQLPSRTPF